ncbi:MAG: DUF1844 domain-containing protein [bacterium]
MSEKDDVIQGPGFTIVDRRIGAQKSAEERTQDSDTSSEKEKPSHKNTGTRREEEKEQAPLPEVDFPSFIMSLCTSVYIHLGEIPDPTTNQNEPNLPLAKQTIDLIAMLKEKTEGNRTEDEDKLLDEMLYSLRMRYIAVSQKRP